MQKYLMSHVAAAQGSKSMDGLFKPDPASWNQWDHSIRNILLPFPILTGHLESNSHLNVPAEATDDQQVEDQERVTMIISERAFMMTLMTLRTHNIMGLASL